MNHMIHIRRVDESHGESKESRITSAAKSRLDTHSEGDKARAPNWFTVVVW